MQTFHDKKNHHKYQSSNFHNTIRKMHPLHTMDLTYQIEARIEHDRLLSSSFHKQLPCPSFHCFICLNPCNELAPCNQNICHSKFQMLSCSLRILVLHIDNRTILPFFCVRDLWLSCNSNGSPLNNINCRTLNEPIYLPDQNLDPALLQWFLHHTSNKDSYKAYQFDFPHVYYPTRTFTNLAQLFAQPF